MKTLVASPNPERQPGPPAVKVTTSTASVTLRWIGQAVGAPPATR